MRSVASHCEGHTAAIPRHGPIRLVISSQRAYFAAPSAPSVGRAPCVASSRRAARTALLAPIPNSSRNAARSCCDGALLRAPSQTQGGDDRFRASVQEEVSAADNSDARMAAGRSSLTMQRVDHFKT